MHSKLARAAPELKAGWRWRAFGHMPRLPDAIGGNKSEDDAQCRRRAGGESDSARSQQQGAGFGSRGGAEGLR